MLSGHRIQLSCTAASSRSACRRGPLAGLPLKPGCDARSHLQAAKNSGCLRSRAADDFKGRSSGQCTPQHHPQQQRPNAEQHDVGSRLIGSLAKPIVMGLMASALVASPLMPQQWSPPAAAADFVGVGTCLLAKCQLQLAECLADATCLQNVVCLNACNGQPDETGCQIRCGDLYGDKAIDTFNACAVSDKKCVPQRVDEGVFPVPNDCALDNSFDLSKFTGRWFITAGLNPLFDTFDCQEHFFAVPEASKMVARINWRISRPDGDFIDRSTIQTFIQEEGTPSHLINHGNEYLHYEDDWYILGYKPDSYVVVYYIGNNDAWRGYGGAVIYTKARHLPDELVPEISAALEKVGLKWADFKVTDNTCGPHPPRKTLAEEVSSEAEMVAGDLRSFGRGFTVLEKRLEEELTKEEQVLAEDLRAAERLLEKVEREVEAEEAVVADEIEDFEDALSNFAKTVKKYFQKGA